MKYLRIVCSKAGYSQLNLPHCTITEKILTNNSKTKTKNQPLKKTKDWSGVAGFGSFDNGTCKRVLDMLETG